MTRAVLLPSGADPFLIAYWMRHYKTWKDSIDELHVAVCGQVPDDVLAYIKATIEDVGGTMYHFPRRTAHGLALSFLFSQTSADYILLMEDDAFIRKPEVIEASFAAVESGATDIIASPRESYASVSVIGAARLRFGDEPQGLAFWPCFLFVSRAHLEATDKVFDGTIWPAGATILGTRLDEEAVTDTFIWASYQLREQGLNVRLEDGYRMGANIPDTAPWFHVGSLSSGHGWSWLNPNMEPDWYAEQIQQWQGLPFGEAAKRMAWWQRTWDRWDGGIPEYHAAYGDGIRQFMEDFRVDPQQVAGLRGSYNYLVTWPE
jgi:hypothetical protein